MKKTLPPRALLALLLPAALAGCASMGNSTVLVDGPRGLENFNRVGEANWSAVDGAIQATAGGKDPAYLVTKVSYTDFVIRAEFWASDDANSGVFIRCRNPAEIGDETCYEANIFDQRPDPTYGTGAIVKVAAVSPMPKAGGKWNTYEITARGKRLTLVLNGVKTVDVEDGKLASGPIALQWGRGTIKFRKVEITPL
ncbi:DUF1080 domain-containing protein [Variovorax sp. OV329]|uniref:3-keto-disaccharide hydrolase n=1 Tax=Variovorax sp. OV329 TaxID=1882825 RepID=UPI0008EF0EDD|nr:DUF1080 domain-containing protein [Variovorax sp. OV329]SFN12587.1 protein of unknown function [Variovorax sp. OV329]